MPSFVHGLNRPLCGVLLVGATLLTACTGKSGSSASSLSSRSSPNAVSSALSSRSLVASSSSRAASSLATSSLATSSLNLPLSSSSRALSSSLAASSQSSVPMGGDLPPVADVSGSGPLVALAPNEILFKADRSFDPDGVIVGVEWDFGDGQRSNQINPRHRFAAAGTYSVKLTVTDNSGMQHSTRVPVTLLASLGVGLPPVANIQASSLRGEIPLAVTFDGSGSRSVGRIVSYEWDLGAGQQAFGPVIQHQFTQAIPARVYLTVTDDTGQSHETAVEISPIMSAPKGIPGAPLQTSGNPFADSAFYVSPDIELLQNQSLTKVDPVKDEKLYRDIQFVQQMPSAVWLDRTIAIYGGALNGGRRPLSQFYLNAEDPYQGLGHFDEAVRQQQALMDESGKIPPMTAVIIVYNLPDRDCAALASNGLLNETNDGDGDGKPDGTGMQAYKEDYIDVIAEIFARYPTLRIVAMLEPDGYPNMITNVGKKYPKCDAVAAAKVYEKALQYAIAKFAPLDNVYVYMDIGHSGWLGWANNMSGAVSGFTKLVKGATPEASLDVIKGFASNTSGYTPLREPFISNTFESRQALAGFYEWNQMVDELSFIDALHRQFTAAGFPKDLGFIIDTSRNGWGSSKRPSGQGVPASKTDAKFRIDLRAHRGHWCNVADAGIGEIPQANPDPDRPYLDAYYWMKPPGESDGIATKTIGPNDEGKSYDPMCGGESSNSTGVAANVLKNAPHAGHWFHEQFIMLMQNAYPTLGQQAVDPKAGGAKPALVETFDSFMPGNTSPRATWEIKKDGNATVEITDKRFFGLRGNSLKIVAPEENQYNNSLAMMKVSGTSLGAAGSDLYGRARIFIEDAGPETDMKWTLATASGNRGQVSNLQHRLGSTNGNLSAVLDSENRAGSCEKSAARALPKGQWVCLEWHMDPANTQLEFWIDGESVSDLKLTKTSPGCSKLTWEGAESYNEFYLGVGRYKPSGQQQQGQTPKPPKPVVTAYFDDVALSSGRLGCGRVRP